MYKEDLALNNQQRLICHKIKQSKMQTATSKIWILVSNSISKENDDYIKYISYFRCKLMKKIQSQEFPTLYKVSLFIKTGSQPIS